MRALVTESTRWLIVMKAKSNTFVCNISSGSKQEIFAIIDDLFASAHVARGLSNWSEW